MNRFIEFFAGRHLFTNFLFFGVLIGGIFFWQITPKEELPNLALDFVRITVAYPGASAEEVEYFVTWPIEDELRSVNGIDTIKSTSAESSCIIYAELEKDLDDRSSTVTEIKNAVLGVDLPDDILDLPRFREFKSSQKAIIDIGIYLEEVDFLTDPQRRKLQTLAHTLENRLLSMPEVNTINKGGYLKEELHVLLKPERLESYRIPVSTVISEIRNANVRQPAGSLESVARERVTVDGELDLREELLSLPVQGNFEGRPVRLSDIAEVRDTFEENKTITKINGREAVFLNVVKSGNTGILTAIEAVKKEVERFGSQFDNDGVTVVFLDDESQDVKNRMSLIGSNGLIGFSLILLVLFIFLNFVTGFWVAMGIPFTFGLTIIAAYLFGYTVNNITLAAVLIVMGMIVDDAIVVSENITRLRQEGVEPFRAAVEGASYVLLPITASILTTCAAFLPLLSLEGRVSFMSDPIPPIVSIMLLGSLIESVIILPAHMNLHLPRWLRLVMSLGTLHLIERYFQSRREGGSPTPALGAHWFRGIESWYASTLNRVLKYRVFIILFFALFVMGSVFMTVNRLSFALFPREETKEVFLNAETPAGTGRVETAKMAVRIEELIKPYLGKEVVGFRTVIGQRRHGASARDNLFTTRIEVVPRDERGVSLNSLLEKWENQIKEFPEFSKVRFIRGHFGSDSGSPVEVVIQENDNRRRDVVAGKLAEKMKGLEFLTGVEVGEPYRSPEYRVFLNRELIKRLGINPSQIGQAFRTAVEGTVIYEIISGDEEKNVRVSMLETSRNSMREILDVPVVNREGYLVPLREVVTVKKTTSPLEVRRLNNQRMVIVYADIARKAKITPLEVADYLEEKVFPGLARENPTTIFSFEGEIKMTRETTGYFPVTVVMVLFLIYTILALQFNSMTKPLIIMMAIPPAVGSVAFTFWFHGMATFGFFGVIGAIGLSGVVVNDSIILLKKLDDECVACADRESAFRIISETASTRLRAVLLTTITTVAGLLPTAYGITGYDSMLAEMMLALSWGLVFGSFVILLLVPAVYSYSKRLIDS